MPPLGVQLYSLRDPIAQDPQAVLNRVADIGFAGVELHAFDDAARIGAICKDLNLPIISAHIPAPFEDNLASVMDTAESLGSHYLLIPWLPPEHFTSTSTIQEACERINRINDSVTARGFELGYHHHWFEMYIVEGRPAYQIMLDHLAPSVFFEIDTYWVQTGGQDPAAVLTELGDRAPLLHVKDGPATTPEANMTAAGEGVLNFPAILPASRAKWFFIELDRTDGDMFSAIEKSYQYLTQKGFAHGR
jgi:sugar phosphate isomerase/epimerase